MIWTREMAELSDKFVFFVRSFDRFCSDDSRAWIYSCAHDFHLIGECFGALLLL